MLQLPETSNESLAAEADGWSHHLLENSTSRQASSRLIGVLSGEGIGPEVIAASLQVLNAVGKISRVEFEIEYGTPIGRAAERNGDKALPDEAVEFCRGVFSRGGAVLSGPGGGRYVYDMRRAFDLFCKLSPLKVYPELHQAMRLKTEHVDGVEMLMVRDNASGLYQGTWNENLSTAGRSAEHRFSYSETDVRRILLASVKIAQSRRGEMTVVYKESGVPSISKLWRDCAQEVTQEAGVQCSVLDIDNMAYQLIQHPKEFDLVVAPNMFGDILSDLGAVLMGSRGLSFGGSFSVGGASVYQTNHGAAYDLAESDHANPVGQIFSLAMLLRESFNLMDEAALIEEAVARVWRKGWRTKDLAEPGCSVVGTREMAELVAQEVLKFAGDDPENEPA